MALNFPPSDASPWTAPNGVVYTWNTDGYWEAKADPNDFDTDYLKLNATNDPVTGNLALDQDLDIGDNLAVTGTSAFTGLTTHEAGVSVTGGDTSSSQGIYYDSSISSLNLNSNTTLFRIRHNNAAAFTFNSSAVTSGASQASGIFNNFLTAQNFTSSVRGIVNSFTNASPGGGFSSTGDISHFYTENSNNTHNLSANGNIIGFHSDIDSNANNGDGSEFNFYAAGDAPNYFAGATEIVGTTKLKGSTSAANTDAYIYATRNSSISPRLMIQRQGATSSTENALEVIASTEAQPIQFALTYNGNFTRSALAGDYRLTDYRIFSPTAIQNASQIVSQLSPKLEGFIAHELQSYVPEAVIGTQDAEEAIGTLADYNGTVLETEVTEPSAEDLTYTEEVEATPYVAAVAATYDEYGTELTAEVPEAEATYTTVTRTRTWTPSGNRPVYQGVDQTKLIPLLTKALQEALDKIETLETRLSDAGIA